MSQVREHWLPAYVGLGSNLDDPEVQIHRALDRLAQLEASRLIAASPLYKNPPMGPQDQPDYVNAVAGLVTRLPAEELLQHMQALEQEQGRVRKDGDRWGPRVINLDLLVYGRAEISVPGLTLPHPGISERNFVLLPLCNIAPTLEIPGQGTVQVLTARVDGTALQRLDVQEQKLQSIGI